MADFFNKCDQIRSEHLQNIHSCLPMMAPHQRLMNYEQIKLK